MLDIRAAVVKFYGTWERGGERAYPDDGFKATEAFETTCIGGQVALETICREFGGSVEVTGDWGGERSTIGAACFCAKGDISFKSFCTSKYVSNTTRRALMTVRKGGRPRENTYCSPLVVSEFRGAVQVEPATLFGGEDKVDVVGSRERVACVFDVDCNMGEDVGLVEKMSEVAGSV